MTLTEVGMIIFFGILPSLFWLIFFLFEDRRHPEPKQMIAGVFVMGAISAIAAAIIQILIKNTLFEMCAISATSLVAFILFAFIEEMVKFLAAYVVIFKNKNFNEPIDAMIYMMTAALGFAALENIVFLNELHTIAFEVASLRFIGATLLHALASGFVGYYWLRGKAAFGIFFATAFHVIFNLSIIYFDTKPMIATGILILASFFIFYDFGILKDNEKAFQSRFAEKR